MLCIDHQHFDMAFKQVIDRFPVHSRPFYSHMSTSLREQPIQKIQQVLGRGRVRAKLFLERAILLPDQQTHSHRFLMHIKACTSGIKHLHLISPAASDLPVSRCSEMGEPEQRFSSTCSRTEKT